MDIYVPFNNSNLELLRPMNCIDRIGIPPSYERGPHFAIVPLFPTRHIPNPTYAMIGPAHGGDVMNSTWTGLPAIDYSSGW